jgi:aspartate dehydrogenase
MPKKLRIGILGCGAIGSSLAKIIRRDFRAKAEVSGLFDIDKNKSHRLAVLLRNKRLAVNSLTKLINRSDFIIEATHARSAYNLAKRALGAKRDVMIMRVGGIIDQYKKLSILAQNKGRKVYIPSGAICGLDGLKAARGAKIKKVTLTTTKPPEGFGIKGLKKDKVLFQGSARDAVKCYPQNINVAAALSIAGIGPEKTKVRIVASPGVKRNIHSIEILSSAGKITATTQNLPHPDNPKTSFLAVLSAAATLRQVLEPIRVGT